MIRVALLALFCTTSLLAAQETGYIVRPTATPCLNIRPAPDTDMESFDCVVPGTALKAVGAVPYWREVRLGDGRTGWAAKKFLEIAAPPLPPSDSVILADNAWLEVHFVDVGQGDAIWIATFDEGIAGNGRFEGRNLVIDGGPNSADQSNAMLAYLQEHAHEGALIDALVVTHAHNDHYNGADGVLRHFEVRSYYDPGYDRGGTAYPAFLAAVHEEVADGQPIRIMLGRDQFEPFDLGEELQLEVLYSYPGSSAGLGSGSTLVNNSSIVLRLTYGEHSFLFMGDAEGKDRDDPPDESRYVEKLLLESQPAETLRSTVLKIAHHGSETSSTWPFIRAVDPELLVVQSGRKPFSGTFLPDATTLQRYCDHNPDIRIYRTDRDDAVEGRSASTDGDGDHVVIRTNGKTLEVRALSNGEPYSVASCSATDRHSLNDKFGR